MPPVSTDRDQRTVEFATLLGEPSKVMSQLSIDGALRGGHFRLLSGQHTDVFIAFSAIAADPRNLDEISSWLGPTVDAWAPDAVLSPCTAGVGLAATLARRVSAPLHLAAANADGRPSSLLGSGIAADARVLLVNDVNTTGTAIDSLARVARANGADVVGATWFASRSFAGTGTYAFPTAHIASLNLTSTAAASCVQCAAGDVELEDAQDLN